MKFGTIELTTKRLKLRQLKIFDAQDLFGIYSDSEVMKYWSSPPFENLNQANEMISNTQEWWAAGNSLCFGVEELGSNSVIGTVSLFSFHEESRRAEIGYILGREYWGSGYMYEATKEVVNYVFSTLNLNRLEADIDPDNAASAALLRKLGFSLEGRLKQRWIVNGNISDSELYGLVSDDLSESRGSRYENQNS